MVQSHDGGMEVDEMKNLWRWVVYFWWAKIRRKPETVCPPNCKLCEVQVRINAHYDACPTCQGDGYPCEAMTPLCEEEDRVTEDLFPWVKKLRRAAIQHNYRRQGYESYSCSACKWAFLAKSEEAHGCPNRGCPGHNRTASNGTVIELQPWDLSK